MRPILFDIPLGSTPFGLHTYGVSIAVAFLVAIAVGTRTATRSGENADRVRDLCFWLLISSLVGARLLFILTNIPDYVHLCRDLGDCTRAFRVWEGGLVFFGGFFGALITGIFYMRHFKLRVWRIADILAPSVPLGQFFGRLGCWAAGCCWGRPADGIALHWAARFPRVSLVWQDYVARHALSPDALTTPPLHPVQLYEALANLGLFLALSILGRRKRFDGEVLCAYLGGYAILRFILELFRGDDARKFVVAALSTSQAIALVTLPLALALAWHLRRKGRSAFSRA